MSWLARSIVLVVVVTTGSASAQLTNLEFTEILFNPVTASESRFEWVEVRNTGGVAIDLDGYILSDFGDTLSATNPAATPINILSTMSGGNAANTVVPAGTVAVLYNGTAFEFDDSRFRAGWNMSSAVPLIGVDGFPALNSSGVARQIGLWDSVADWELDAPVVGDQHEVTSLANAALSLNYTEAAGYPVSEDGRSIRWTGLGSVNDGAQWSLSESGVEGATTSVATFLPGGEQLNGPDIGSPNVLPAGPAAAALLITEFVADPADSPDAGQNTANDFEWIELFNNTAASIDLTGYLLDDTSATPRTSANIAGGSIASGATGVLFDAGNLAITDMETMWGPGNYIPVTSWPTLNNGGDTVGLWNSLASYQSEATPGLTFAQAEVALNYQSAAGGWPDTGGAGSIYLTDLDSPNANGENAFGSLWSASTIGTDGAAESAPLFEAPIPDYHAGDVGSPGTVGSTNTPVPGDFNNDGTVNAADYTVWRDNLGSTVPGVLNNAGDESGPSAGVVDGADYQLWKAQFAGLGTGTATLARRVPEPNGAILCGFLLLGLAIGRRMSDC